MTDKTLLAQALALLAKYEEFDHKLVNDEDDTALSSMADRNYDQWKVLRAERQRLFEQAQEAQVFTVPKILKN